MRHAMAGRRRNNHRQGGGGSHPHHRPQHNKATVFDSNGPDVRIRGTAYQIVEKYMALAKDAAASGDRVLAENYLQHAEHYQRMVNSWNEEQAQRFQAEPTFAESDPADSEQPEAVMIRPSATPVATGEDSDLGLPASILGAPPQASAEDSKQRLVAAG